jgi:hypothetical protein
VPNRNIVVGSGTVAAAGPCPSLKLVKEPVSLLVEAESPSRRFGSAAKAAWSLAA